MNKQQYEDMRRLVQGLENQFRDLIKDSNHPTARAFEQRLRSLEDDFQTLKNPRSIESSVSSLENDFDQLDNAEILDHSHSDHFTDEMRQIKVNLRKFENY